MENDIVVTQEEKNFIKARREQAVADEAAGARLSDLMKGSPAAWSAQDKEFVWSQVKAIDH